MINNIENPEFKVFVRCMTYNQSKYIVETMNGFTMQQTDFPFVCCIVDDSSTDGEQDIISKYLNKYFDMALKHYPVLADSLIGYLSDKNELNTYFKHNFSFKEDYRNLEILPLDEELKYKVTALQD